MIAVIVKQLDMIASRRYADTESAQRNNVETLDHLPDTGSESTFGQQPARGRVKSAIGLLMASAVLLLAACGVVPQAPERRGHEAEQPLVFPQPPDEPRFYFERSLYGSPNVVPGEENSSFRQLLTGEKPKEGEGMNKPFAIAVHQGRVYVSDTVERFVTVFDFPNKRFYHIGDTGPGQLTKPLGLDVDRDGNVYVADATARMVVVFDQDGNFLRKLGGKDWFERPSSVTIDPRGDRLYVIDVGGVKSDLHRVRVFDPVSGKHLFDFGTRGGGPGEFNFPYDITLGKEGNLYLLDTGNFRVQVFDRDGKFLRTFGEIGSQIGGLARPKSIAADADGNLYITDAMLGRIQIFDPDGNLLLIMGQRSDQDGPARFNLPTGISVDEDGRVYVIDQWFRKIDVFRPARLGPNAGYLAGQQPHAPPPAPPVAPVKK